MKRNNAAVSARRESVRRGSVQEKPADIRTTPDAVVVRAVVAMVAILMAYAVIWWLVGFEEAAGLTALGASGLAAEIVRRLLKFGKNTTRSSK